MQKITIDFLKNKIYSLKKAPIKNIEAVKEYLNEYSFTEQEVLYIYKALNENNKKFNDIKNFLFYLKLQKINFKYFNNRLKRIAKLKNNSMSLICFLLRYGKNKAKEFYEQRKKSVGKTKKQYIEKFGKEEAEKILKTKGSAASLDNCIKKYGEKDGKERWDLYIKHRAKTYEVNKKLGKYKGKYSLDWFIFKYGEKKGKKFYKEKINKLKECSGHLQKNESNIANELFKSIHENLLKQQIKIDKILYKPLSKEYVIWLTEKKRAYIDFYIKLDNGEKKIIEFYGDYWHANPSKHEDNSIIKKFGGHKTAIEIREQDKIREDLILKKNKNLKIIWESDFKKNKEKIIVECCNFIIGV